MEELGRTGQPQFYEKEYANKNGSRTSVGVTLGTDQRQGGQGPVLLRPGDDLSEKKRAERLEKEVQDIKERNQLMVSTAFEGLAIVQEGKIVEVNERLCADDRLRALGAGGHAPRFVGDPGSARIGLPTALRRRRRVRSK